MCSIVTDSLCKVGSREGEIGGSTRNAIFYSIFTKYVVFLEFGRIFLMLHFKHRYTSLKYSPLRTESLDVVVKRAQNGAKY